MHSSYPSETINKDCKISKGEPCLIFACFVTQIMLLYPFMLHILLGSFRSSRNGYLCLSVFLLKSALPSSFRFKSLPSFPYLSKTLSSSYLHSQAFSSTLSQALVRGFFKYTQSIRQRQSLKSFLFDEN